MTDSTPSALQCLDVEAWRIPSKEEMRAYYRTKQTKSPQPTSILAVRQHLLPVDVYCYLKARFGQPNGFQNLLRSDSSDNIVHWNFLLKAGTQDVYISGTSSREIHFVLSERLTDEDWRNLILKIKTDYKRVGKAKSAVLKSLEKWVRFPNKFVAISRLCGDLHAQIIDNIGAFQAFKQNAKIQTTNLDQLRRRALKLYQVCLELSLVTPVMAEAFINMTILMFCKKQIRDDPRQFEAFIREQIDLKICDLPYKCERFVKPIDRGSENFKNFKRIVDKRNHVVHGNIDPEREQTETVYFEGRIPLFGGSGDHIQSFCEALERQYEPETVIKDYEDTHAFLLEVVGCLEPGAVEAFWYIMEDAYPGYDLGRKITGRLFPDHVVVTYLGGVRYDDELAVNW